MGEKKKIILINGDNSNWYEQIIFIVKDDRQDSIPKNLVLEAEKIINDYMAKKYSNMSIDTKRKINDNMIRRNEKIRKTRKNIDFYHNILNISIFFTVIFICYLLYQIYV